MLEEGLPRPNIDMAGATRLADEVFGVTGAVRELGSQQDRNFLVASRQGDVLLKVSNRAFGRAEIEAQNAVMRHVRAAGIDVPVPLPSQTGDLISTVEIDGEPHHVRLLSFVAGTPLIDRDRLTPSDVAALGDLTGRTSLALAGITHEGLERRDLQWDLRSGEDVVRSLADSVPDEARRARVLDALAAVTAMLDDLRDALPVQTVHGDLTDDNVVMRVERGACILSGIIDFGDAMTSWRVAEVAVACTAALHREPDDPLVALPLVRAFDRHVALTDGELRALWPLVVLRGAVLVVSGLQQVAIDPGNDYAAEALEREWSVFASAASLPFDVAERAVRLALDRPAAPFNAPPAVVPAVGDTTAALVDLGWSSDDLREGDWLEGDGTAAEARAASAAAPDDGVAITRFGEGRLTRATATGLRPPVNVGLGVDVHSDGPVAFRAPIGGEIARTADGHLAVVSNGVALVVAGLESSPLPGTTVAPGEPIGTCAGLATVWATTPTAADGPHKRFVTRALFRGLRSRYADPTALLSSSVDVESADDIGATDEATLARRARSYSPVQGHYFEDPPRIERGWREHLIDVDGRHYLDMVNNVTVLGHGHPAVARAAERQWRLLNTNSRFHYSAVAELSERLLETLPTGAFDAVLLVNSGTEAVDLALRLARAFSGRPDVACVAESYHGWSLAADAVSTSTSDNPRAGETRPSWVHVLDAPNAYRGRHRGTAAGAAYARDAISRLGDWAASGTPIGTFIAEPRNGNAGGIAVPPGYLGAVYDAVRAGGGVVVSDEVQVGYGRQGEVFWGFEEHAVVPDIVTMAKAMGDGHPIGAVITRGEIVDALADQGTVFSSAGGSTLSARIGVTVLDVLLEEDLPGNARRVGELLRSGLIALAEQHPLIGAVHGRGLYLGVELVRDPVTREPADTETRIVCDRLRDLGVIEQPTGDRGNVLKVKPPMCFSAASAAFFLRALDIALAELE
ncbi:aminotransferase [Labedella phragmitis]|uniref:Aminotransferase n=1 Tax=Labedella phragmitis TaxID=2498849 RepID=A0A444PR43_9MICO|nr:aminotransferase [Labedella phragmitis]RWZ49727.1 aminotransferase [Labedella phragmitis]